MNKTELWRISFVFRQRNKYVNLSRVETSGWTWPFFILGQETAGEHQKSWDGGEKRFECLMRLEKQDINRDHVFTI